jgi:purine-binding chemotaxis protein CheW
MTTLPSVSGSSVLALRTSRCTCAVPLAFVTEVMRPLPVEPLAGAPVGVCGLAIIRGRATPVVDLEILLGSGTTTPTNETRFVTLRVDNRPIALLVGTVLTTRTLDRTELESLPMLWQGAHPPAVAALGALDSALLIVLEAARLLPDAWPQPAAAGGTP